jgi:hypothetical protein
MTLVKTVIKNEMERFFDQESLNFIKFPGTIEDAAIEWSGAVHSYARQVTPPSVTSEQARISFYNTFVTMNMANGQAVMRLAFNAYAAVLALGMQASGVYVAASPANPIDFSPVYTLGLNGGKNKDCLDLLIDIIDAWFRTGTATNIISGVVQPWS